MHGKGNFQTKVTFVLKVTILPLQFSSPSNQMKISTTTTPTTTTTTTTKSRAPANVGN